MSEPKPKYPKYYPVDELTDELVYTDVLRHKKTFYEWALTISKSKILEEHQLEDLISDWKEEREGLLKLIETVNIELAKIKTEIQTIKNILTSEE